jgi:chromosome segregation ATPase
MNSISKVFEKIPKMHFITLGDGTKGVSFTLKQWNQLKSEIQGHTDYLEELIHGLDFQIDNLMDIKHQSEKQLIEKDEEIERLKTDRSFEANLCDKEIIKLNNECADAYTKNNQLQKQNQELQKTIKHEREYKMKFQDECFKLIKEDKELKEKIRNRIEELRGLMKKQFDKLGMSIDIDDFIVYTDTRIDTELDTLILAKLIKELNSLLEGGK